MSSDERLFRPFESLHYQNIFLFLNNAGVFRAMRAPWILRVNYFKVFLPADNCAHHGVVHLALHFWAFTEEGDQLGERVTELHGTLDNITAWG